METLLRPETKAKQTRDFHKKMMESGDSHKALTALLIENGHGLTGPAGMYGVNALSDYENPTKTKEID